MSRTVIRAAAHPGKFEGSTPMSVVEFLLLEALVDEPAVRQPAEHSIGGPAEIARRRSRLQREGGPMATYQIILSISLYGELQRRSAPTRAGAFATAVRMLNERSADEVCVPAMHREVVALRIEEDDSPP